jgi:hypothetical protein
MNKPLTALAVLLLIGSLAAANNWTMDGDSVYWTENGYTIRAYPAVSKELVNHYQYVNFTSTNPANIMSNLSFVFDTKPLTGDVLLWQNTSHQIKVPHLQRGSATYELDNVVSYSASTAECGFGDGQALKYNVTFGVGNTSSTVFCFDSYTNVSDNYTLTYSYNYTTYTDGTGYWMDWSSILNSFTYAYVAGHHVYTINDVPFDGSTNYQTLFRYSLPVGSSGKFDIYAHRGSPQSVLLDPSLIYVRLDPWYNSSFNYKVQVNVTNWNCSSAFCQFPITIALNKTVTNGSDIRVVNSTETGELSFWREDPNGGAGNWYGAWNYTNASGVLWVNASNQTTMFYIYYNASGVADKNNIDTTFVFGDDFTSWNASKWKTMFNVSGSSIVTGGQFHFESGKLFLVIEPASYTVTKGTAYARITGVGGAQIRALQTVIATPPDENTNINTLTYGNSGGRETYNGAAGTANNSAWSFPETVRGTFNGLNWTNIGMTKSTGEFASQYEYTKAGAFYGVGIGSNSNSGEFDYFIVTAIATATPTFTFGAQQSAPALPSNITCLIQTKTDQYNGTMVNYTLTGIFHNPTASSQTVNLSITANGTSVATNNSVAIAAGGLATLTGNYTKTRGSLDTNFTVNASATGSDPSVLNGSSSSTVFLILPIDPPSAINLMNSGGKTRCRTPQDVGYWDGRNWSINASWNCNYTNLNLTSTTATATTKGTYASFLHDDGFTDADNASDGSYTTKTTYTSFASNSTYWNYTNPATSLNQTTWQVKHGKSATYNITLASQYANQATIMVKITSNNSNSTAGNAASSAKTTTTWASSAGIGNVAWTNPDRAQAQDTSYATAVLAFNASAHNRTVYLNGSGWGFAIPTDAVITGVLVDIRRNVSSVASSRITMDNSVRLQVAGAAAGDDEATTTQYTTAWATASYGGATNLATTWNTALTPASVNAANFGILFSAKATGSTSTRTVNVDFINMTVFYNTSSNFSQSSAYAYNGTAWVKVGTDSTGTNDYTASDIYEQDMYFNSTAASGNIAGAGIKFVDSGTTTFSNSNITVSVFDRLVGDLGTAAIFVFQQASNLLIK